MTTAPGAVTAAVPIAEESRAEQMFPTLTAAQVARIAGHGRVRQVAQGDVLVEPGEQTARFFVVTEGQVEIVRPTRAAEEPMAVLRPGQFTGEVHTRLGRRRF